jgi:hypothetical protein
MLHCDVMCPDKHRRFVTARDPFSRSLQLRVACALLAIKHAFKLVPAENRVQSNTSPWPRTTFLLLQMTKAHIGEQKKDKVSGHSVTQDP